jgi:hypothetical protein
LQVTGNGLTLEGIKLGLPRGAKPPATVVAALSPAPKSPVRTPALQQSVATAEGRAKPMKRHSAIRRSVLYLSLAMAATAWAHAADNLRLNSHLNYSSDSQDGPLITGDHLEGGAVRGKPNYVIFYGEG